MVLSAVLTACGGSGRPVPFTDVSTQLRGFEATRVVRESFTSRGGFADYLRHAMPGRAIRVPPIDWAHREAVLVSAGPRSSTGYALDIVSVRKRGGRLVVTAHERTPSLGEPVQARVTYPYSLITIPRTEGKLLLHFEGRP
jgi:hypothetical protein